MTIDVTIDANGGESEEITSSATVERKVEQIVCHGTSPDILDDGYEHDRARALLSAYAELSRYPVSVRERAQSALDDISPEEEVTHVVHFHDPIEVAIEGVEGKTALRCTSVAEFDGIVAVSPENSHGSIGFSETTVSRIEPLA